MTQGNTPSLQRENHTHTHTHTTTTLFMTIPIKSHISTTIDSKIYWELHKIQSQIKNRKEDHY